MNTSKINKFKKLGYITFALVAVGASTELNLNNTKVVHAVSQSNQNVKSVTLTLPANIKNLDDALSFIHAKGYTTITKNDITNFVASQSANQNTKYGPINSNFANFHAIGPEETTKSSTLPIGIGWTKTGTENSLGTSVHVDIPGTSQVNGHELQTKDDVLAWLQANGHNNLKSVSDFTLNSQLPASLISDKFVVDVNNIPTGYELDPSFIWTLPATTLTNATGVLEPKLSESEQEYNTRMHNLGYKVYNYQRSESKFNIPGNPNADINQAKQYVRSHEQHYAKYVYNIHSIAFRLKNLEGVYTKQHSDVSTFLDATNVDSQNERKLVASSVIGEMVKNNQISGLDTSDSKYQDIDAKTGLPKFVVNMLIDSTNPGYYKNVFPLDGTSTGLKDFADHDYFDKVSEFDEAYNFLKQLGNKISQTTGLDANVKDQIVSKLNAMFDPNNMKFTIHTNDNKDHSFDNMSDFYQFIKSNASLVETKSIFSVWKNGRIIFDATSRGDAQAYIDNANIQDRNDFNSKHGAPTTKLTYNGQDVSNVNPSISDAELNTLKSKLSTSNSIWKLDNNGDVKYFVDETDAKDATLASNKTIAKNRVNSLSNLTASEKSAFNKEIDQCTSEGDLNLVISKASSANSAKMSSSDKQKLLDDAKTQLSNLQGLDASSKSVGSNLLSSANTDSDKEAAINKVNAFLAIANAINGYNGAYGVNALNQGAKTALISMLRFDDKANNDNVIKLAVKMINYGLTINNLPSLSAQEKHDFISRLATPNVQMLANVDGTISEWNSVLQLAANKNSLNALGDQGRQSGANAQVANYRNQVISKINASNLSDVQKAKLIGEVNNANSKNECQQVLNKLGDVTFVNNLVDADAGLTNAMKNQVKSQILTHSLDDVKTLIANLHYAKKVDDEIKVATELTPSQVQQLNVMKQAITNNFVDNVDKYNDILNKVSDFVNQNLATNSGVRVVNAATNTDLNPSNALEHTAQSVKDTLGLLISSVSGSVNVDGKVINISSNSQASYMITGSSNFNPDSVVKQQVFTSKEDAIKYLLDNHLVKLVTNNGEVVSLTNDLSKFNVDLNTNQNVQSNLLSKETVTLTSTHDILVDAPSSNPNTNVGLSGDATLPTLNNNGRIIITSNNVNFGTNSANANVNFVNYLKENFDLSKLGVVKTTGGATGSFIANEYKIVPTITRTTFTCPNAYDYAKAWQDMLDIAFNKSLIIPGSNSLVVASETNIKDFFDHSSLVDFTDKNAQQRDTTTWHIDNIDAKSIEELTSKYLDSVKVSGQVSAQIKQLVPISRKSISVDFQPSSTIDVYKRQMYGSDELIGSVSFNFVQVYNVPTPQGKDLQPTPQLTPKPVYTYNVPKLIVTPPLQGIELKPTPQLTPKPVYTYNVPKLLTSVKDLIRVKKSHENHDEIKVMKKIKHPDNEKVSKVVVEKHRVANINKVTHVSPSGHINSESNKVVKSNDTNTNVNSVKSINEVSSVRGVSSNNNNFAELFVLGGIIAVTVAVARKRK